MALKENKIGLYVNMVLGTIGTLLIALSAVRFQAEEEDLMGNLMILFGIIFTLGYISYLEEKAGINKKWTWIRVSVFIILFASFSYFLYF